MNTYRSRIIYLLPIIGFFMISACKSDKKGPGPEESKEIRPESNLSDEYVSGLYEYYTNEAVLQDHIDQNLIIDYIVAGDLEYKRLPSGLFYHIIKEGSGENYKYGQKCIADYSGYFLNSEIFDSSYPRGEALKFNIGQMVNAWNEILQKVNPGTSLKIIAPSRLAYGSRGFPGYVPPNTVIAFDIVTISDQN